jgi:phosphate transport system permease protein
MRKLITFITASITGMAAVVVLLFSISIAALLFSKGHAVISWEFLSTISSEAGASGGILWQIVGSLILIATAAAVALPIAVSLALLHSFFLPADSRSQRFLGFTLQIFNAVPSIIFGILGLLVFTHYLEWGKSWLAGGILLGIMIVPTIAIMVAHRISVIRPALLESAFGLGLNKGQIVRSVVIPQCSPALISGLLLGLARAAGETAPILFVATIFSGATLPHGIKEQPVLALPYHIFILAQDSFDDSSRANLWGAALVLVAIVSFFGLLSIPIRQKLRDAADHA